MNAITTFEKNLRVRETAAQILKAMAHPVRLGVLASLVKGEQNIGELQQQLECSQSMMSQQVRILEQQKLIQTRKEGTLKYIRLQNEQFIPFFSCLLQHMENNLIL